MQDRLSRFKAGSLLNHNQTEKILYILGSMEGEEGQAILILTPRLHSPTSLPPFHNSTTAFINDIYSRYDTHLDTPYQVQLIHPCTDKHINKYSKQEWVRKRETGEEYRKGEEQMLNKELKHLGWVENIVNGKSEAERVLYKSKDFLILPDFKFTDHSDPNRLHLLVLFTHPTLTSLRSLTTEHVPLLKQARRRLEETLADRFGLKGEQCRMYFHYPPTFYRLHIHVMHLNLESLSCRVERCHDFETVIDSLTLDGGYYQKATLNTLVLKKA